MGRDAQDRPEDERDDAVCLPHERAEQRAVRPSVHAKPRRGRPDRPLEQRHSAVVEGMRQRRVRVDELDIVTEEVEAAEERGGDRHPEDRRADVVDVARERQLRGAHAAPDRVAPLVDDDRTSGPRDRDRRRQPVGPGADDDGVGGVGVGDHPAIFPPRRPYRPRGP